MNLRTVLIIKMGTTFPSLAQRRGDFEDWIIHPLRLDSNRIRVVKPYDGEGLPDPHQLSGVVVTGSHTMVTDREGWSEGTAAWLSRVVEDKTPLLGICYGHQLLAHAMGGVVGPNPLGSEFGTIDVRLGEHVSRDSLFAGFPSALRVQVCHAQSVLKLPPGATLLASNDKDPHHAFSIGGAAWGVQFHPEFDADIIKFYIKECTDALRMEGLDPARLLSAAENTPYGEDLLRRFGKIILENEKQSI
jgi:GMP synthase (glutamine-hydrolysing)